jgi:hypothetical protein
MKPNLSHFLGFTFFLMTVAFFSVSAQEGVPNNEIPDLEYFRELNGDKPLLVEPEKSPSLGERSTSNSKDQLISTPKSGKSKTVEASKNPALKPEEDALSFNFLYYIIQKFKISDIVEQ